MKIRRATPEDANAIYAVHTTSIRGLCRDHYSSDQIAAWTSAPSPGRYLEGMRLFQFLVAEQSEQLLGFCILSVASAEINALYVSPSSARMGVGRALYEAAESIAVGAGATQLTLKATLNAVPFYEHCGLTAVGGIFHSLPSGQQLSCIHMVKPLAQTGGV